MHVSLFPQCFQKLSFSKSLKHSIFLAFPLCTQCFQNPPISRRLKHMNCFYPYPVLLDHGFIFGRGYRNGYPFPKGENIVLGETDHNRFTKTGTALGAMDIRFLKPRIVLGETDMFTLEVSTGHEIDMRCTQIAVSPSG